MVWSPPSFRSGPRSWSGCGSTARCYRNGLAIVTIDGLTKRFGDVLAVDNLSFEVDRGTVVGSLGPNGAGKTTTLRTLLGLVIPTAGSARIDGRPYRETTATAASLRALASAASFWMLSSPSTPAPSPPWCAPGGPTCFAAAGSVHRGRHRAVRLAACGPLPHRRGRAMLGGPHPSRRQRPDGPGSAQPFWGRHLNRALHLIVLTQLGYDPATPASAQRRRAQARPTAKSTLPGPLRRPPARPAPRAPPTLTQHRSLKRNDRRES